MVGQHLPRLLQWRHAAEPRPYRCMPAPDSHRIPLHHVMRPTRGVYSRPDSTPSPIWIVDDVRGGDQMVLDGPPASQAWRAITRPPRRWAERRAVADRGSSSADRDRQLMAEVGPLQWISDFNRINTTPNSAVPRAPASRGRNRRVQLDTPMYPSTPKIATSTHRVPQIAPS